ncbi:hypothetical protein HQ535_06195, partial [bacterium]|nr:hypothetical protein [bacterium]
ADADADVTVDEDPDDEVAVTEAMARAEALGAEGARDAVVSRFSGGAESHPDDLKEMKGVGPVLEGLLNGMNIKTFEQVGSFTAEDVAMVSAALKSFPDRVLRDRWVAQAKELHAKYHGA